MPWSPKTHRQRQLEKQDGTSVGTWRKTRRTAADRFRSTAAWQRFRRQFRRANPLCANPFGTHDDVGGLVPMDHVHHIVAISEAPDRALDESNCVALCEQCHHRVEGMVKAGVETCQLFGT